MTYYIDLFSPETYLAYSSSDHTVTGFRIRHKNAARHINKGDIFVCYLTKLSRWFGLFEVLDGPFIDSSPRFTSENDPFVVRFRVTELAWLDFDKAIPIHSKEVWGNLSFTRELPVNSNAWTGKVRGSLVQLNEDDGHLLSRLLLAQKESSKLYPLDESDHRKISTHTILRENKEVTVTVPEDDSSHEEEITQESSTRESIKIQALISRLGARMGMKIWIPRSDKNLVLKEWPDGGTYIIERLPLNYDETTLHTIEQIDVLWLKNRSIKRAFEVEHTTSVYSGILRMADLLSLQPNMDIKLHIVAPDSKRDKVFQEIRRPVFTLLERGPLAECCTFISYDSLYDLADLKYLEHTSDSVLDEYSEKAGLE